MIKVYKRDTQVSVKSILDLLFIGEDSLKDLLDDIIAKLKGLRVSKDEIVFDAQGRALNKNNKLDETADKVIIASSNSWTITKK